MGADINFLTAQGQSCLHLAAELCNKTDSKVEMTHSVSQVQDAWKGMLFLSLSPYMFFFKSSDEKNDNVHLHLHLPIFPVALCISIVPSLIPFTRDDK